MDLRLFHPTNKPDGTFRTFDRINGKTGFYTCRLLEWSGWYTQDIQVRLLGHYRLFQLYKKHRFAGPDSLKPAVGYLLQYRASYWIKHRWYMFISRMPSMFKYFDTGVEMYSINKLLINERADILIDFLTDADTDFEPAFKHALNRIRDSAFIHIPYTSQTQNSNFFLKLEQHNITDNSHNELNIHPIVETQIIQEKEIIVKKETVVERSTIIKEPAKDLTGKEKGVFSKRQILIFFDLLTRAGLKDRILLAKTDKHEAIANFLQAVTGKGSDTWLEMLKNYKDNDLYAFNTPEERANLAGILKNIANIAYHAGFRSIQIANLPISARTRPADHPPASLLHNPWLKYYGRIVSNPSSRANSIYSLYIQKGSSLNRAQSATSRSRSAAQSASVFPNR